MLEQYDFKQLCKKHNISEKAKKVIENIRDSPPKRVVGGGRYNVSGRYPSKKMGVTIQFESHKVELAAIYQMEYDNNVLEFYDQPSRIKLNYINRNGRNIGVMHTPDFFVLRKDSISWEEWKSEEKLLELSISHPNRYVKNANGEWSCPPGEEYAKRFGLQYKLRSSAEIDWKFQRNIQFLEDYILDKDYMVKEENKRIIVECIKAEPGIALSRLLENTDRYSSDEVYYLLSQKSIYVNFFKCILSEPDTVKVFTSREQEKMYVNMKSYDKETIFKPEILDIQIGKKLIWDGNVWTIINVGEEFISLISNNKQTVDLPIQNLRSYVDNNKIEGLNAKVIHKENAKVNEILLSADESDLKVANNRFQFIYKKINNEEIDYSQVSPRTLRYWYKKYREAEEIYGNGYLGLIPQNKEKGNRTRKLPSESIELMNQYIEKSYESIKQKNKICVYGEYSNECDKKGILAASYTTFCKEIDKKPKHIQVRKRMGNRAAYKYEKFHWELSMTTPRHGDRPFEICHIDHTLLDVELISSLNGENLERPWVTFLVDAFTRKVLSFYLTYDPPSYRSNMMVLRECVRNHNRLPQIIVVDGGKDFQSIYFETVLSNYYITKKTRPAAKARFGSVIERLFGTANTTFIHNLQGNTQIMKNVRQVTKSINPKNHAIWTLSTLYERLKEWCYDIYDTRHHTSIGCCPREAFKIGIQQSGKRLFRLIPYDKNFIIMTQPSTKNGKSKVQPGSGVKINYINYWSDIMKDPQVEGTKVSVRYDPFNIGVAYAYIKNKWIECISEYHTIFNGVTEREKKLITAEIKKQNKNSSKKVYINAKKIARFINSIEGEEVILNQKNKEYEAKQIIKEINNYNQDEYKEILSIPDELLNGKDVDSENLYLYGEY